MKQLDDILYLQEHDLIGLLDENVQEAIKYRQSYPETSLQELADIISNETGRQIGKSGVNHYFIKVKKLVKFTECTVKYTIIVEKHTGFLGGFSVKY